MMDVLEPLAAVPGVRVAILVTPDGVPVIARGKDTGEGGVARGSDAAIDARADSMAGLAAGWLQGLTASIAPLGWSAPGRVVLRAARGTLVMSHAPGSVLLVVLDPGASAEELRLPMEAAVARIQRILRGRGNGAAAPSSPLPSAPGSATSDSPEVGRGPGLVPADSVRKPNPRPFTG